MTEFSLPIPPLPSEAIKYSVPFGWGAVLVSQEAADEYGFVPLTPNAVKGTGRDEENMVPMDEALPQTYVQVVSSAEARSSVSDATGNNEARDGFGWYIQAFGSAERGHSLTAVYSQPVEKLRRHMMDSAIRVFDISPEDVKYIVNDGGIPLPEIIDQNVPQYLVHSLADTLVAATSDHQEAALDTKFTTRDSRRLSRAAIALGGGGAGVTGWEVASGHPNVYVVGAAAAIGSLGLYVTATHNHLLNARRDARHAAIHDRAHRYGAMVGRDFHAAFCRHIFDATLSIEE